MLLSVKNLTVSFKTDKSIFKALKGISFDLKKGETFGIVGESGSGKSVTAYSIMGLLPTPPAYIKDGTISFMESDLLKFTDKEMRKIRGDKISMIFQDPMTSLNPFIKIKDQISEPLILHKNISKKEAYPLVIESLKEVGILDADKRCNSYPHELSGGMRQRVMIAMALITEPELLIADEPTTALDVTTQAQILLLLKKLQKKHNTSIIFITHDLGVISNIADRVAVVYSGEIVESGLTNDIFKHPLHPYTKALIDSIPAAHIPGNRLYSIPPQPSSTNENGCLFAPRCNYSQESCFIEPTNLSKYSDRLTRCTLIKTDKINLKIDSENGITNA